MIIVLLGLCRRRDVLVARLGWCDDEQPFNGMRSAGCAGTQLVGSLRGVAVSRPAP